jgi:hypothetical protein
MRSALFRDVTQRKMLVMYRRFGITHRSVGFLNMGPAGFTETPVTKYKCTLRNISEERKLRENYLHEILDVYNTQTNG